MKMDHLQQSTENGNARVEFIVPEWRGEKIKHKSLHAYLGSGELCAEIHMSIVGFTPEDQKLFEEVLASAKLLPDAPANGSSDQNLKFNYIAEGSRFYVQHDYRAAAERYAKALDLEKRERTLGKTMFRVLVDNLGTSYGISGNLAQARETFEYGITQDAEYPLFYYNMACNYGEMGKMDESLEQLRIAYKYKANMISGESFPDPLKDDSFRNFAKNENFVRAVREMQR